MAKRQIDLGLTALDELFMSDEGRKENRLPRIHDIELKLIDDFPASHLRANWTKIWINQWRV